MTKEIADVGQAAEQNFRAECLLHARKARQVEAPDF